MPINGAVASAAQMQDHPQMPILELTTERYARGTVASFAALVTVAAAVLIPFYLLASAAVADPLVRQLAASQPVAVMQIVAALAFWGLLFGLPLAHLLNRMTVERTISLSPARVAITERRFGRSSTCATPLAEFLGVSDRLRTTLSGLHPELVLVHSDRARSVRLLATHDVPAAEITRICDMLKLPQIPYASCVRIWKEAAVREGAAGGVNRMRDHDAPSVQAASNGI